MNDKEISGLHHVTAIAGDPQINIDFYAGVLGLRLVKLTVNFDDPSTYHLYYGDGQGHPGTILTFFPWPGNIVSLETGWKNNIRMDAGFFPGSGFQTAGDGSAGAIRSATASATSGSWRGSKTGPRSTR